MIVSDLKPGDGLDLENLQIPGPTGIGLECELALVEEWDGESRLYTDAVNLTCRGDDLLEPSPAGGWRFVRPSGVGSWTW